MGNTTTVSVPQPWTCIRRTRRNSSLQRHNGTYWILEQRYVIAELPWKDYFTRMVNNTGILVYVLQQQLQNTWRFRSTSPSSLLLRKAHYSTLKHSVTTELKYVHLSVPRPRYSSTCVVCIFSSCEPWFKRTASSIPDNPLYWSLDGSTSKWTALLLSVEVGPEIQCLFMKSKIVAAQNTLCQYIRCEYFGLEFT